MVLAELVAIAPQITDYKALIKSSDYSAYKDVDMAILAVTGLLKLMLPQDY